MNETLSILTTTTAAASRRLQYQRLEKQQQQHQQQQQQLNQKYPCRGGNSTTVQSSVLSSSWCSDVEMGIMIPEVDNNGVDSPSMTNSNKRRFLPVLLSSRLWNDNTGSHHYYQVCNRVKNVFAQLQQQEQQAHRLCECYLCASIDTTRQQMQLLFVVGSLFWTVCILSICHLLPQLSIIVPVVVFIETVVTKPVTLFVVTMTLFTLQILLSIRYDGLVRQRHQAITEMSEKSQNLVCDIYPETVRGRLLQSQSWKMRAASKFNSNSTATSSSSQSYIPSDLVKQQFSNRRPRRRSTGDLPFELRSSSSSSAPTIATETPISSISASILPPPPIVDNYSSATVLFADIVGFTLWSSSHDPYQVFTYLETLYAAFDTAAIEHDIFKVETIGDSYMAVSGIPDPNNVHTIRMVSFACTLLQQVTNVSNELDATLGGTAALGLRIGINSGPVTAGVLRGQKARFQLFGDTVNTASRMESTGVCNKIQISQATADLLLEQGGRSHWFEHRTERIIVKGKGEMTTYWIVPNEVVVNDTVSFSAMVPPSNVYDPEVPPSSVPLLQTNVIDSDVGTSVARRRRSNDSANGNYYDHYDSDHYQHDTNTSIVTDNINDTCQLLDKEDNEQNKLFCPTRTRPVCRRKSCLA